MHVLESFLNKVTGLKNSVFIENLRRLSEKKKIPSVDFHYLFSSLSENPLSANA